MQILTHIDEVRRYRKDVKRLAFVPTMGNLHDGHLSLVKLAKQHADEVIVSIFVNRLQFGPNEDFDRYPRTFEDDCAKLRSVGCDAVFHPDEAELYPEPQTFAVEPPPELANILCGAFRPGHFRGVCTVVAKLFNIVQPDAAVFGLKDYQQFFILKKMVEQMGLPIEMIGGEIVREANGLAMSSRNRYLSATEREQASLMNQALRDVAEGMKQGGAAQPLADTAKQRLTDAGWRVQYVEVRDADTLSTASVSLRAQQILAAAYLGQTRLIDNVRV